jgi:hypothetical protein
MKLHDRFTYERFNASLARATTPIERCWTNEKREPFFVFHTYVKQPIYSYEHNYIECLLRIIFSPRRLSFLYVYGRACVYVGARKAYK